MITKPRSELTIIFIAMTIMLAAFAVIGYLYLIINQNALIKQVIYSEGNIIGNLSDHRRIANMTRDHDSIQHQQLMDILAKILNQTR
jgi:hypothetical protein